METYFPYDYPGRLSLTELSSNSSRIALAGGHLYNFPFLIFTAQARKHNRKPIPKCSWIAGLLPCSVAQLRPLSSHLNSFFFFFPLPKEKLSFRFEVICCIYAFSTFTSVEKPNQLAWCLIRSPTPSEILRRKLNETTFSSSAVCVRPRGPCYWDLQTVTYFEPSALSNLTLYKCHKYRLILYWFERHIDSIHHSYRGKGVEGH